MRARRRGTSGWATGAASTVLGVMGLSAVRRHSAQEEAVDVNFAVHLPVIDRLFGTYYLPREAWPTAYGIAGDPVPDGYLRQLVFPFSSKESPVERATRQT